MFVTQLRAAVGNRQPNQVDDVRLVQKLLNRNGNFIGVLDVNGVFDLATEHAILRYKREVMRRSFVDEIIRPGDETFWRLVETRPRRILAGAMGGILLAPVAGESQLSPEDFTDAAQELICERRAVMAVAAQEARKNPFDMQGRPTILFERHHFSRLTLVGIAGRSPTSTPACKWRLALTQKQPSRQHPGALSRSWAAISRFAVTTA